MDSLSNLSLTMEHPWAGTSRQNWMLSCVCHDVRDEVVFQGRMGEITMDTESSETLLHFHAMKMTAWVAWCRISLIIFLHWKHFDDYFLRWQKHLMHESEVFSVCSITENHLKIHFSKFPPKQETNTVLPKQGTKQPIQGSGSRSSMITFTWPRRPWTCWCPHFHESSLG